MENLNFSDGLIKGKIEGSELSFNQIDEIPKSNAKKSRITALLNRIFKPRVTDERVSLAQITHINDELLNINIKIKSKKEEILSVRGEISEIKEEIKKNEGLIKTYDETASIKLKKYKERVNVLGKNVALKDADSNQVHDDYVFALAALEGVKKKNETLKEKLETKLKEEEKTLGALVTLRRSWKTVDTNLAALEKGLDKTHLHSATVVRNLGQTHRATRQIFVEIFSLASNPLRDNENIKSIKTKFQKALEDSIFDSQTKAKFLEKLPQKLHGKYQQAESDSSQRAAFFDHIYQNQYGILQSFFENRRAEENLKAYDILKALLEGKPLSNEALTEFKADVIHEVLNLESGHKAFLTKFVNENPLFSGIVVKANEELFG